MSKANSKLQAPRSKVFLESGKRHYNNQLSTFVRALDAIYGDRNGLRALSRLQTRWPAPHWSPSWPEALAKVHCDVLFEPPPRALPPIGGFR